MKADNLNRFMQCNSFAKLDDAPSSDEEENQIAREGEAFHWLAVQLYKDAFKSGFDLVGQQAPNGVFIDRRMAEYADEYIDRLSDRQLFDSSMEVDCSHEGVNGRADHTGYDDRQNIIYIDDAKYGYGIVEPEMNWTLISHAIGTAIRLQVNPNAYHLSIFQPRAWHQEGNWRTWIVSAELMKELYSQLKTALVDPLNSVRTSPNCSHCSKLGHCPAARMAFYSSIDQAHRPFSDEMSDEELAEFYALAEYAEKKIKEQKQATKELLISRRKAGRIVGDYQLEPSYGHRKFKEGLTPELITAMTGVDVSRTDFVTPAEAERRGIPREVLDSFTDTPSTGVKLIRENANKRANRLLGKKA